jgi:hypothetical protein
MKTSTFLTAMLAGAAVCALSTAPALAGAPNIHVSAIFKTPVRLNSGMAHFKTNMAARSPHNASTFTSSISLAGTVTSHFNGLLYAYTWYTKNTAGKCVQPKKQKQKYTKPLPKKTAKVTAATTVSGNPCGTGNFTYFGPSYQVLKAPANVTFSGKLTAKKFYGDNLVLNEAVSITQ